MLKKIGIALATVAVCLGMFVMAAQAQPGKAKWRGNHGNHTGWHKESIEAGITAAKPDGAGSGIVNTIVAVTIETK